METLLCRIEGAGKVKVLLTESMGERIIYQTDEDSNHSEKSGTVHIETVIVSNSGKGESGLIKQVIPPAYLGAVVLCQGADKPSVKLAIMEAVANATGLGTHHISVLKMK